MDADIIKSRERQRQFIKQLRGKRHVNAMFIISSLSMWNHQRLYELMAHDPRFKVTIIFVPFCVYSDEDNQKT